MAVDAKRQLPFCGKKYSASMILPEKKASAPSSDKIEPKNIKFIFRLSRSKSMSWKEYRDAGKIHPRRSASSPKTSTITPKDAICLPLGRSVPPGPKIGNDISVVMSGSRPGTKGFLQTTQFASQASFLCPQCEQFFISRSPDIEVIVMMYINACVRNGVVC